MAGRVQCKEDHCSYKIQACAEFECFYCTGCRNVSHCQRKSYSGLWSPRQSCSTYLSLLGSNLSQSQYLSYRSVKDLELYTYDPSYYLSCLAVRANICWSPMRNALNMHSLSWWSLSVARAINKTINLHGNVVR